MIPLKSNSVIPWVHCYRSVGEGLEVGVQRTLRAAASLRSQPCLHFFNHREVFVNFCYFRELPETCSNIQIGEGAHTNIQSIVIFLFKKTPGSNTTSTSFSFCLITWDSISDYKKSLSHRYLQMWATECWNDYMKFLKFYLWIQHFLLAI